MKKIEGNVSTPKGFKSAGMHCGIVKNKNRKDLALIVSEVPCAAANVYTQNKVKGAPIYVTQKHCADNKAQAIICNSGNANTCNANGIEIAEQVCAITAKHLGFNMEDIIVASTGVIGRILTIEPFVQGISQLAQVISSNDKTVSQAILTTDLSVKEIAFEFEVDDKICTLGAIAKGSGMINPNMATMLCFITTDVAIEGVLLQEMLFYAVQDTFNMISVDGDTSTNDMVSMLANGMAGNALITKKDDGYYTLYKALVGACEILAKMIARDGEGATKLITCSVNNAPTSEIAKEVAMSVIKSDLVKTAIHGEDANVGRIICAMGYTTCEFDITKSKIAIGSDGGILQVSEGLSIFEFDEEKASEILSKENVEIIIDLNQGMQKAKAWGCDLSANYIKINGGYRS